MKPKGGMDDAAPAIAVELGGPSLKKPEDDKSNEEFDMAAEHFIDAVAEGDKEAAKLALKAAIEACDYNE